MKISVSVWVARPIADVWQGWNTPASIMAWNAASPQWHCPQSRVDLRVGGRFCHHMAARDGSTGFDFEGTFTEVTAPTGLGYVMDDGREVSVRFVAEQGGTRVEERFDAESLHSGGRGGRASWITSSAIWNPSADPCGAPRKNHRKLAVVFLWRSPGARRGGEGGHSSMSSSTRMALSPPHSRGAW